MFPAEFEARLTAEEEEGWFLSQFIRAQRDGGAYHGLGATKPHVVLGPIDKTPVMTDLQGRLAIEPVPASTRKPDLQVVSV